MLYMAVFSFRGRDLGIVHSADHKVMPWGLRGERAKVHCTIKAMLLDVAYVVPNYLWVCRKNFFEGSGL